MATIFSKIVAGEIPCFKIAEDDQFLAFLDVMPLKEGHTLIIPKKEIDYIFDIEDEVLGKMMQFAKKVAHAIKLAIPCEKIGVSVIGLEVPHAHIHLIPMNNVSDMNFSKPKLTIAKEEMAVIAERISLHLK
jgi:histidine triad (HIT) family protein